MKRRVLALALLAACRPEEAPVAPVEHEVAAEAKETTVMVWPDEEFRYTEPEPGPTPQVTVPLPEVFEMDGGMTVYLVRRTTLPTVSLSVVFPTGTVIDPPGKRGLASTCMDLMEQGTEALDKPAFEARKADLASSVSAWANVESSGVALSCLHRNFEDTAALMLEMLDKPGLRERDLARLKARRKANLTQNKAAPGSLGRRLWRSVVWGPGHPYGQLTTEASYGGITVADCRGWLGKLGTEGASIFVAGATDEAELRRLLEGRLVAWGKDKRGKPRTTVQLEIPAAQPRKGTIFFADVPGAAQSQIYIGQPAQSRLAPDYEATSLMAAVLGGSFSSRINMNIREDKGWAYGARANFSYRKHGGTFAASSSVRSDVTAESLGEMLSEIEKIRAEGVLPEELQREREGTLLRLPSRFSTARRVRSTYSTLVYFGLPLDYYDGYQKRIEALDASDLKKAARERLLDSGFKVLVVGDGDTVRPKLQELAAKGRFGDEGFVELDGDGSPIGRAPLAEAPPPT